MSEQFRYVMLFRNDGTTTLRLCNDNGPAISASLTDEQLAVILADAAMILRERIQRGSHADT